jgi:hypothetical protein
MGAQKQGFSVWCSDRRWFKKNCVVLAEAVRAKLEQGGGIAEDVAACLEDVAKQIRKSSKNKVITIKIGCPNER